MKTIPFVIVAGLLSLTPVRAQWVVYDPAVHTQQILDQAQNIAKYVQMVNNQIQQITRLQSQLEQLQQYNKAFGDPSRILSVVGVDGLVSDLRHTPVGQTITELQRITDGVATLTFDGNGIYERIGVKFKTPSGKEVERAAKQYKPYEAINRTTENYINVTADVLKRRQTLKEQMAVTTERLQSAATASEVQKLTGVLTGLDAALGATDKELDQALSLSLVQDIENRNTVEKQIQAGREEQKAEMLESFGNYRTTFQLNTQPPLFPERE